MKNFFYLLLAIFTISLSSCHKEDIKTNADNVNDVGNIDKTISIFGTWTLVSGKMYMENLETGEKIVYNHFDSIKRVSSLRYSGYMFDLERIVADSTTWTFVAPPNIPNTGEFWLNNDSLRPYGFYVTNSNMSITEWSTGESKLGGSSRPIHAYIYDYSKKQVSFFIQEAYENIDGVNFKYFSELIFQKQ